MQTQKDKELINIEEMDLINKITEKVLINLSIAFTKTIKKELINLSPYPS